MMRIIKQTTIILTRSREEPDVIHPSLSNVSLVLKSSIEERERGTRKQIKKMVLEREQIQPQNK